MKRNKYYPYRCMTAEIELKDGNRDTILKWLHDTHLLEWYGTYIRQTSLHNIEDEIQEIWRILCEFPQERWDKIYAQGQANVSAYVTGIIHQQLISHTSEVYKKYDKVWMREPLMDDEWWERYAEEIADIDDF